MPSSEEGGGGGGGGGGQGGKGNPDTEGDEGGIVEETSWLCDREAVPGSD